MKKLTNQRYMFFLLFLSWLVYFVGYVSRLSYGAVMAEIIAGEGLRKSNAGLIATGASVTYALGQIVSGILGDRFSPRLVMFYGLITTALCNFCMSVFSAYETKLIFWCANGLAQAMLWPPMLRIFTEYYRREDLSKMLVRVSTSNSAGTIAVYLLSSLCIAAFDWRFVFYFSAGLGILVAFFWFFGMRSIEKHRECFGEYESETIVHTEEAKEGFSLRLLATSGIFFLAGAILLHGILKDSVTTWMPTLIMDIYHLDSAVSILSTVVMPIFSMLSLYFAAYLNDRVFRNDVKTSIAFFMAAFLGSLGIWLFSGNSPIVSLLFGTIITSAMYGANLMLITTIPAHFSKYGKASTLTGTLNAFTYVGTALSTYGIGAISETFGWNAALFGWMFAAFGGLALCILALRGWTRFLRAQ